MKSNLDWKRIKNNARSNLDMAIARSGVRCPLWAQKGHIHKQLLDIYIKAKIKNRFKYAYGRDGELWEVDHIVPLHGEEVSGLHVPWNLKVTRRDINRAKSNLRVENFDPHFKSSMKWY